jgi:diguanylate cyclase (GGDEF)-like protein
MMYYQIYIEINALFVFILLYISLKLRKNDLQTEMYLFTYVIYSVLFIMTLDILWAVIAWIGNPELNGLNYTINCLYMFFTGVIGYLWLDYTEVKMQNYKILEKRKAVLLMIPLMILLVLCVLSPINHFLFYINEQGEYIRGKGYFIQLLIAYGYLTYTFFHLIVKIKREPIKWKRNELYTTLAFSVLPLIGGIITNIFYGIPAAWPLSSVALIIVYFDYQSHQISTDRLTGLNNRTQLDNYMSIMQMNRNPYYYFMIDIDRFKQINDNFGHVEGDHALRETAHILRKTCGNKDAFIARYGGDEFAVILRTDDIQQAEMLKNEIQDSFKSRNSDKSINYNLAISIGYSYSIDSLTTEDIIKKADNDMYQSKKHLQNNRF